MRGKYVSFLLFILFIFGNSGDLKAQNFFLNEMENALNSLSGGNATTSQDWARTVDIQGRRYYIGGNLQYLIPNETITPIQFNPPRISAGCGGISVSLGSLSYLKFDQLVDKLQNAIRQAPALAVQLVISNLCEKCASVLSFLEQVSDIINGLNMDSCSLAKAGVGFLAKKTGLLTDKNSGSSGYEDANDWLKNIQNAASSVIPNSVKKLGQEIVNAYQTGLNTYDCAVITDSRKRSQCFADMLGTLGDIKEGILHTAISLTGAENSDTLGDVENILRAYLGDFVVSSADGAGKFKYISPYYPTSADVMLWNINIETDLCLSRIDKDGNILTCEDISTLISNKQNELVNIYNKVLNGDILAISDKQLISSIPIPIYAYFRDIARLNLIDPQAASKISEEVINKVAKYMVLTSFFNTFIKSTNFIVNNIARIKGSIAQGGLDSNREISDVVDMFESRARDFLSQVRKNQIKVDKEFSKEMNKFKEIVQIARDKVVMHLSSYEYGLAYQFANRK